MDIWVKLVVALVALHLIIGFGWLIYKLSPGRKHNRPTSGG
jgi:hypothetical protein